MQAKTLMDLSSSCALPRLNGMLHCTLLLCNINVCIEDADSLLILRMLCSLGHLTVVGGLRFYSNSVFFYVAICLLFLLVIYPHELADWNSTKTGSML